jgi:geranylgeranyl diphosphate synthase, type II
MRSPDDLRGLFEEHLEGLELSADLGGLAEAVRYALAGGGKRIRPVLCLATTEAAGGDPRAALDPAAALELVHSFSLVHDDLPALDDDDERRGRPTVHVRFGEAQAILGGDALLTEAFALSLRGGGSEVGRELAWATAGMIGGQYLDVSNGSTDRLQLNRLKTGRLFEAAVGCGLLVAGVPAGQQDAWREFGAAYGLLYQVVDDLIDADGLVDERGADATRQLLEETAGRARDALAQLGEDVSVLAQLLEELTARAQQPG